MRCQWILICRRTCYSISNMHLIKDTEHSRYVRQSEFIPLTCQRPGSSTRKFLLASRGLPVRLLVFKYLNQSHCSPGVNRARCCNSEKSLSGLTSLGRKKASSRNPGQPRYLGIFIHLLPLDFLSAVQKGLCYLCLVKWLGDFCLKGGTWTCKSK